VKRDWLTFVAKIGAVKAVMGHERERMASET
jgi:hypothetical protein